LMLDMNYGDSCNNPQSPFGGDKSSQARDIARAITVSMNDFSRQTRQSLEELPFRCRLTLTGR
jgi:hypothetical protein